MTADNSVRMVTPSMVIEPKVALLQYQAVKALGAAVYYVTKANPHPSLIKALAKAGSNFQVSSLEEWAVLKRLGIAKSRLLFCNPSWNAHDFKKIGAATYSIDSIEQFEQMPHGIARQSTVLFRVATFSRPKGDNYPNSDLGIAATRLSEYLLRGVYVKKLGLHQHVSSQITDLAAAKENAALLLDMALFLKVHGVTLEIINFGGGLALPYGKSAPSFAEAKNVLQPVIAKAKKAGFEAVVEPGRFICGPAGILMAKVKLVKGNILFIDDSVYRTYLDTLIAGIELPLVALKDGRATKKYVIRGRSMCSLDRFGTAKMPEMAIGDTVALLNAGAYALGSDFMSMKKTTVVVQ